MAALFIWQTWKLSLIKKTTLVLSVVFLLLFIMSQNENLKKRLFLNSSVEQSIANFKHHEPRVIIWACAYQIAKSSDFALFWGIPSEQEIDEKLSACYSTMENQHRANYFKSEKLNVHSQFIAVYLTSGIIGLFLWLMFWSFLFLKSKND
ncbi:O-antigen ligase family protein, partial [Arthrospira platensis SPKY1]|nr:O-antigen ligase family protein [Arthrospira platensis SPKY1]